MMLLAIFHDSFMSGYSGAMWYLVVTCRLGALGMLVILRGNKPAVKT